MSGSSGGGVVVCVCVCLDFVVLVVFSSLAASECENITISGAAGSEVSSMWRFLRFSDGSLSRAIKKILH